PQLLNETVDLASADPVDVRLQHDRDDRLLRAPPRLQEAREVRRARPLLRDQQLDLTDPRLPPPGPIPVAMRGAHLRRDLADRGADLLADLGLHQLAGDQRDRLAHEILKPTIAHLRDDIGNRHALTIGHRGVSQRRLLEQPTSSAPRWPTLAAVDLPDARHTTSTDATRRGRVRALPSAPFTEYKPSSRG